LGRPQSYVSKYERGERRLDVVEFLAVARALGTDAASLVAELERLQDKPASRTRSGRRRSRTGGAPQRRT
jgi:transcriptional regulator with XRE-family HTH domain